MNTAIDPDHVAEVYAKLSVRREGEGRSLSAADARISIRRRSCSFSRLVAFSL